MVADSLTGPPRIAIDWTEAMSIPVSDIRQISEANLLALFGASETENLDFKRETYGHNREGHREVCKDVSALANTKGGDLLIGVDEDDASAAAEVVGIDDAQEEIQRLQNIIYVGRHSVTS